jgi:hypothetical protein
MRSACVQLALASAYAPCKGGDATWRGYGKEAQRRAARKASGVDGTVSPKLL